jgi:hypothetical protein
MVLNVVTVVRDDLEGLKRTAASILEQDMVVSWLIVTPKGETELSQYAEKLFKGGAVARILNDLGNGVYPAMNQAIFSSDREDWIWFLNAGDLFAGPKIYGEMVGIGAKTPNDWIYGGHMLGLDNREVIGIVNAPSKFLPSNQLFSKQYVSHQSTIFRVKLLQDLGGFNVKYKIAADWDLIVRASYISEYERVPDAISIFFMGGLSTLRRQEANRELLEIRKIHLGPQLKLKNYAWYFYRILRNSIVIFVEQKNPKYANLIRKKIFRIRNLR